MSFLCFDDICFFRKYCIVARSPYRFRSSHYHQFSLARFRRVMLFSSCLWMYLPVPSVFSSLSVAFFQPFTFGLSSFLWCLFITHNYCFYDRLTTISLSMWLFSSQPLCTAPLTSPFLNVSDRFLQSTAQMLPQCWACRLAFFTFSYSRCCRWTHYCSFSSLHQLLLPFNTHSYPVGLYGKYGNILTFPAVWLEVWSSAALRLSGSHSRASACPAVLGQRRLFWPAFSRGIPNASSSSLQHSR